MPEAETTAIGGLAARLRAAADVLHVDVPPPRREPALDASVVFSLLVAAVAAELTAESVWLLHTVVTATFPTADDVREALRHLELNDPAETELWLLERWGNAATDGSAAVYDVRIVTDAVVLDVDHCARHDLHTGIQRVVRSAAPYWARHGAVPAAWTDGGVAYRSLDQAETRRVFSWGADNAEAPTAGGAPPGGAAPVLLIPWRTTVLVAEVPDPRGAVRLAAMAELSGNDVVAIGYDCVPIVSADHIPADVTNRFVRYLTLVKHCARVAAISESAAAEFRGFASMLANQGLRGPDVSVCALPALAAAPGSRGVCGVGAADTASGLPPNDVASVAVVSRRPYVLVVGSLEPRKNHLAVLYAAERLWRDGLDFEVHFTGGSGSGVDVPHEVQRLQGARRPLFVHNAVTEDELDQQYRQARFTVFVSVHEGYGLPVAESLSYGVPVIATSFGSVAEIAEGGGCIMIDPRDDQALVDAMRSLLTDEARLTQLRGEARQRSGTTWETYAEASWQALVDAKVGP